MKYKLLFVIPSLGTGGAELALINLLNAIPEDKYKIDLCIVLNQGYYLDKVPKHVNKIILFKNPLLGRFINYLWVKFRIELGFKILTNSLLNESYDVGISYADSSYTHILTLLKNRPKKLITWLHSSPASYSNYSQFYTKKYIEFLKKKRYGEMDTIIFVSNDSMNEFKSIFGEYADMRVIYNVLGVERIKRLSKSFSTSHQGNVNIIAVGSLFTVKGYERLVDACQILKNSGVGFHLRILGKGPLKQKLEKKIETLGLSEQIELLDFVENPYPYILNSDIFTMTSYSEALPTSLCEAIILGKPVCVTNVSGCREVIDSGKYGLMTEGEPSQIALGLKSLISSANKRNEYMKLSKERSSIFSDNAVLDKVYDLIEN